MAAAVAVAVAVAMAMAVEEGAAGGSTLAPVSWHRCGRTGAAEVGRGVAAREEPSTETDQP